MPPEAVHEAWSVMSALAATTSRIELGQLVMCTSFRNPANLRRTAGIDCTLTEPDALARRLDAYDALGIDDVIIGFEPITRERLDLVAAATARRSG